MPLLLLNCGDGTKAAVNPAKVAFVGPVIMDTCESYAFRVRVDGRRE